MVQGPLPAPHDVLWFLGRTLILGMELFPLISLESWVSQLASRVAACPPELLTTFYLMTPLGHPPGVLREESFLDLSCSVPL